ncbi:hypothetical protein F8388_004879 [Cannabis sativa]|uniref:Uncharacterized protein n=1 Tax=Cannabis sativa TaxID=3483 RepID=A0A7J6HPW0_CANSA|nr:hypothetical protein F8388_004879 [Cannabis sativa]
MGKLTPNLDQHSTKALNLIVLQRIDPFIEEILITAAPVTFYEFNIESNQWGPSLPRLLSSLAKSPSLSWENTTENSPRKSISEN